MSGKPGRIRLLRGLIAVALATSVAALPRVDASPPLGAAPRSLSQTPVVADVRAAGRQPLAFVVHPTHPAMDLSWRDARGLVVGSTKDWRSLDGRTVRVRLVLGPAAAARLAGIWLLLGKAPASFHVAPSEAEAAAAVAGDTAALGLVTGEALSPAVRTVGLAGADPVRKPSTYPLSVPGGGAAAPVITAVAFGDVLTSRTVDRKMVAAGDFRSPWRSVAGVLRSADLAFGNFEGTIAHDASPRPGGTSFVSRVEVIEGFTFAGLDFLSLANNHIGDFGGRTLIETRTLLRDAGIATTGAGADASEAREPAILERHGVRFAFLGFNAIIGPPVATSEDPGAVWIHMAPWNPFRPSELAAMEADVRKARSRADVVIVFPHWGVEYVAKPNADQIRTGRAMIDAGADMVIGAHPHWVQGAEIYKGRLIAYSLGNFVFDQTWSEETQQGAGLDLVFWGPKLVGAAFVPVQIEDAHRPRFVDERAGAEILERIWGASGQPYVEASQ